MNFGDFAGNEKLKERLDEMTQSGRVPHTVIFEGRKGLGKKMISRILAEALLCTSDGQKPCHRCPDCIKIDDNAHPDVKTVYAADPKKMAIDEMRNLRNDAFIKSNEGGKKIYLIFDADNMRPDSQNALLKVLEEPPSNSLFVFTCENRSTFLPTILSRASAFEVFPPSEEEAFVAVSRLCPKESKENIRKAVKLHCGNIGNSVSSLGGGRFSEIYETTFSLLEALTAASEMELIEKTAVFENDKELFKDCMSLMRLAVRDTAANRFGVKTGLSGLDLGDLKGLYSLTTKQLLELSDELNKLLQTLDRSPNYNLLLTRFSSRLRMAVGR